MQSEDLSSNRERPYKPLINCVLSVSATRNRSEGREVNDKELRLTRGLTALATPLLWSKNCKHLESFNKDGEVIGRFPLCSGHLQGAGSLFSSSSCVGFGGRFSAAGFASKGEWMSMKKNQQK